MPSFEELLRRLPDPKLREEFKIELERRGFLDHKEPRIFLNYSSEVEKLTFYPEFPGIVCWYRGLDLKEDPTGTLFPGHPCGYIGVNQPSKLYEVEYDQLYSHIRCHGGLTYSGQSFQDILPNHWWFGFDHAHSFEQQPKEKARLTEDFLYKELQALNQQIRKLEPIYVPTEPEPDTSEDSDQSSGPLLEDPERAVLGNS